MKRKLPAALNCHIAIYQYVGYAITMNIIKILQIISNETRLDILQWLGNPALYFKELARSVGEEAINEMGVCVGALQKKSGLSQSTISQYMALMESVELVISKRQGKWTYYSRNEKVLTEFQQLFISYLANNQ